MVENLKLDLVHILKVKFDHHDLLLNLNSMLRSVVNLAMFHYLLIPIFFLAKILLERGDCSLANEFHIGIV